jgi:two-component system NtrC family sensor kinase
MDQSISAPPPRRLPLLVFAVVAVSLLGAGGLLFRSMRDGAKRRGAAEIDAVAALKVAAVTAWRDEAARDVLHVASEPAIRELASTPDRPGRSRADPETAEALASHTARRGFEKLALLGLDGTLRLERSAGARSAPYDRGLVERALASPAGIASSLAAVPEEGSPRLDIVAAVRDREGRDVGALYARLPAAAFLDSVVASWPVPSTTAESVVARPDGDAVLFVTEPRHLRGWALRQRIPISDVRRGIVRAVLQEGVFEAEDFRGTPLLGASRRVPGSDWSMVTRMDRAEMEAPILGPAAYVAALAAAILLVGGLALVLSWRQEAAQHRAVARLRAQLERSERMASLGTLAAGVAHEINNPLAYVLANLDELAREIPAGVPGRSDLADAAIEARDGARRVRDVVRGLKAFSRSGSDPSPVDVGEELAAAVRIARNEIRHRARLEVDIGPMPHVASGDRELGQVFLNLLVNAAQAIPDGAPAEHAVAVVGATDESGWARVEFRDTGVGIPARLLPRIFEPFFTTKPVGVGTGLGLAVAHGIVSAAGGRIEVESEEGRGSTFRVLLPPAEEVEEAGDEPAEAPARGGATAASALAASPSAPSGSPGSAPPSAEPPAAASPPAAPSPVAAHRPRVLVVDDDPLVARTVARALQPSHDVVTTHSAADALERLERREPYDALVCDLMMPEMTGMELYERAAAVDPALPRRFVFVTGGAFTERARDFVDRTPNACLEKPFEAARLREAVRRAGRAV